MSSLLLSLLLFILGGFLNPNTVPQNCIYGGLSELIPKVWGFVSGVEGFHLCYAGSAKGCVDPPHQGKDGLWGRQAFSSF